MAYGDVYWTEHNLPADLVRGVGSRPLQSEESERCYICNAPIWKSSGGCFGDAWSHYGNYEEGDMDHEAKPEGR